MELDLIQVQSVFVCFFQNAAARSFPSIRSLARPPTATNIPPTKRGWYRCVRKRPLDDFFLAFGRAELDYFSRSSLRHVARM